MRRTAPMLAAWCRPGRARPRRRRRWLRRPAARACGVRSVRCSPAVRETPEVGVDLVPRNEPRANPARDRLQLALANQRAYVVLGALELGCELLHGHRLGPFHG